MKTILFYCLAAFSILLPTSIFAEVQQLFDQTNSQYIQKNYSVAIHDYESLLLSHGASTALCYNLGLAYAKDEQPGKAIVNLERAIALSPGDTELTTFLADFKKREGLFETPPQGIKRITTLLSFNQWALLTLLLLALFSSFFFLSSLVKKRRWLTLSNRVLFSATFLFLAATIYQWEDANPSIVVQGSRLLISPIEGADLVGSLREGEKVFTIKRHGHYLYIRDSRNKKGWITEDAVEAVNAPQFSPSLSTQ